MSSVVILAEVVAGFHWQSWLSTSDYHRSLSCLEGQRMENHSKVFAQERRVTLTLLVCIFADTEITFPETI